MKTAIFIAVSAVVAGTGTSVLADEITLSDGSKVKGLVVEERADSVTFSTVDGEIIIPSSAIRNISYDDPILNNMKIAEAYRKAGEYEDAVRYYKKVLEIAPDMTEAKEALVDVRQLLSARSVDTSSGLHPVGVALDPNLARTKEIALEEEFGLRLTQGNGWIQVLSVERHSIAETSGFKEGDKLVKIKYMPVRNAKLEDVIDKLLESKYALTRIVVERDTKMEGKGKLGMGISMEKDGPMLTKIEDNSPAAKAGLRKGDIIVAINKENIRYTSMDTIMELMEKSPFDLTIRRNLFLQKVD